MIRKRRRGRTRRTRGRKEQEEEEEEGEEGRRNESKNNSKGIQLMHSQTLNTPLCRKKTNWQ